MVNLCSGDIEPYSHKVSAVSGDIIPRRLRRSGITELVITEGKKKKEVSGSPARTQNKLSEVTKSGRSIHTQIHECLERQFLVTKPRLSMYSIDIVADSPCQTAFTGTKGSYVRSQFRATTSGVCGATLTVSSYPAVPSPRFGDHIDQSS